MPSKNIKVNIPIEKALEVTLSNLIEQYPSTGVVPQVESVQLGGNVGMGLIRTDLRYGPSFIEAYKALNPVDIKWLVKADRLIVMEMWFRNVPECHAIVTVMQVQDDPPESGVQVDSQPQHWVLLKPLFEAMMQAYTDQTGATWRSAGDV